MGLPACARAADKDGLPACARAADKDGLPACARARLSSRGIARPLSEPWLVIGDGCLDDVPCLIDVAYHTAAGMRQSQRRRHQLREPPPAPRMMPGVPLHQHLALWAA